MSAAAVSLEIREASVSYGAHQVLDPVPVTAAGGAKSRKHHRHGGREAPLNSPPVYVTGSMAGDGFVEFARMLLS
jgi:hypothetical protein